MNPRPSGPKPDALPDCATLRRTECGGNGEIRTHERLPVAGFQIRCLQPLGHVSIGAGEGNRTLVVSLEGFCSAIELHPQPTLTREHHTLRCVNTSRSKVIQRSATPTQYAASAPQKSHGRPRRPWFAHATRLSLLRRRLKSCRHYQRQNICRTIQQASSKSLIWSDGIVKLFGRRTSEGDGGR